MKGAAYVIDCSHEHALGTIEFLQTPSCLRIDFDLVGIPYGLHGCHIHTAGAFLNDYMSRVPSCEELGGHYNPTGQYHGGLNAEESHTGDLGNIYADEFGIVSDSLCAERLTLSEVLGKYIIIHADRDDLGKGGDEESLETGNSGRRIAYGVILQR